MSQISIVIFNDPKSPGDESLGRIFNALVLAADLKTQRQDFEIYFQGAGTRWIAALEDSNHPAHELYTLVKTNITGASKACATVFNAKEDVEKYGINLIDQFQIPSLGGATSLASLLIQGKTLITF